MMSGDDSFANLNRFNQVIIVGECGPSSPQLTDRQTNKQTSHVR
jgi:hypothetical protein